MMLYGIMVSVELLAIVAVTIVLLIIISFNRYDNCPTEYNSNDHSMRAYSHAVVSSTTVHDVGENSRWSKNVTNYLS